MKFRDLIARAGLACGVMAAPAAAEVKPNPLFTDGMVLQQGRPVAVWGTADDGEAVTVKFQGQEVKATAKDGKWAVKLASLAAGGPDILSIKGTNEVVVKDVLVGEVWLASGQSNMEWPVRASTEPESVRATADDPMIRLFSVPRVGADEPRPTVEASWKPCTPANIDNFSAVAFAFGKQLRKALGVPVGLINTSYGGTPAEAWTSREALEADPALKEILGYNSKGSGRPAVLYNAMIAPLIPYGIRGAIWYQGESNASRAAQYRVLFPAMIADWRRRFDQGDFPFLFVQLAPFMARKDVPSESQWAELREAQSLTKAHVPAAGMAVITELGDEKDIHPKQKEPVGARLALEALRIAYGKDVVSSGPTYKDTKFDGNKAILGFDDLGGGLVAKGGGPLTGFTVAGADKKFVNAQAEVVGDTVVVTGEGVAEPKAVRFGWADFPIVNLYNKADLPASPFRTDGPR